MSDTSWAIAACWKISNCRLVCKQGLQVLTHKILLASHSQFLKTLLAEVAPSGDATILLPDWDATEVQPFIDGLTKGDDIQSDMNEAFQIALNSDANVIIPKDVPHMYDQKNRAVSEELYESKVEESDNEMESIEETSDSINDFDQYQYKFPEASDQRSHEVITNTASILNEPPYCKECDMFFADLRSLRRHFENLHKMSLHPYDHFRTSTRKSLKNYVEVEHNGHEYNCDLCDKKYKSASSLNSHVKFFHEGISKSFRCDICDKIFSGLSSFNFHTRSIHEKITFDCDQCDYKARQNFELVHHIKLKHECSLRYQCEPCGRDFSEQSGLDSHTKRIHEGIKTIRPKRSCEQCGKLFNIDLLRDHIAEVHEGQKYYCEECGNQFDKRSSLKSHIFQKHKRAGIKFPCDVCLQEFNSRSQRSVHKRIVHEKRLYSCEVCGKEFKNPGGLSQHINGDHKGVKFNCDNCSFSSKHKSHILRHKRTVHREARRKAKDEPAE